MQFYLFNCGERSEQTNTHINIYNQTSTIDSIESKSDYTLAFDFLTKLKATEVDTIIFCKRTCINYCDYFNVFWIKNGESKLNKFYFDFNDMKTHSVEMEISDNRIFAIIIDNYSELKEIPIKDNSHKRLDWTSAIHIMDHYCYTQLKIYLNQDSLINERIEDHYFDEFTDFIEVQNDESETNDNYQENIDSKWNKLLTVIENELAIMEETSERELETLRTRKK